MLSCLLVWILKLSQVTCLYGLFIPDHILTLRNSGNTSMTWTQLSIFHLLPHTFIQSQEIYNVLLKIIFRRLQTLIFADQLF